MSTTENTGFLPIGTQIGEYQITQLLGQGGFGITYKAWDNVLKCDVAIKEYFPKHLASRDSDTVSIRTTVSTDADAYHAGLMSFVKEAQILAKFQHSAIVPVKRLVQANQTAYMVMGFVEGHALSQYLSEHNNQVLPGQLIEWTRQLLDGLREVHQEGLLHRDIKPGNVYIKSNGQAMLLDFGAARHAAGEASMTATGLVSGGYSPPEQYSERTTNQGPWSDIYGLSATLYRCITGEKPASAPDRIDAIHDDEGDLLDTLSSATYPAYAENFLTAVNQGLRIRRKQRLQSVDAFAALISPSATSEPAHTESELLSPKQDVSRQASPLKYVTLTLSLACVALVFQQGWFSSTATPTQLGITLVDIPAGRLGNEELSSFKMMTTEVTWSQFEPCIDDRACVAPDDAGWGRGDMPVINVSWNDVQIYVNWLERKTGLSWRLPSESEWEYAARAGSRYRFNWNSNLINPSQANYVESRIGKTVKVGSYGANEWGLYDMHGNVVEWTQDCWEGDCSKHVWRGGSWLHPSTYLYASRRFGSNAKWRSDNMGFRLVQVR
jgi:serine/threonine protein kinase